MSGCERLRHGTIRLVPFPPHIARVLDEHRIQPETKEALYDLYVSMGEEVLEVFSEIAEGNETSQLPREVTEPIRNRVVERYLARNHPKWLSGVPTASFWRPRDLEGRASGLAVPLGELTGGMRKVVPADQPLPDGIVMLGRNAHFGGRQETVSFDIVARDLGDAIAIGQAKGQQHTLPGSVGETSGTFDAVHGIALVWEVQPNVYKPAGDRNREIARIYRRHRNWHLLTLASALEWLRGQKCSIYVLRGAALAPTHEVNPEKPVSPTIVEHHDRTVSQVVHALGLTSGPVSDDDEFLLLESHVMNHALRKHVLQHGAAGAMWKVG